MNILIHHALILPMNASKGEPRWFHGSVGVSGERIVMVARAESGEAQQQAAAFRERYGDSLREIDGAGKLVMPGLINLHTHVAMTLMRGYADDMPLMPWLSEKIWPFEAKMNRDDVELGARLGIAEMLSGGTTTFVDMYWMEEAVACAVREAGIRAVLSPAFIDARFAEFEHDLHRLMKEYCGGRIRVMAGPHSPYTCSAESIRRGIALSREYDIPLHIHLSETQSEVEIMRERYGKTSTEWLEETGFFERPALVVHAVHLTGGDRAILRKYGVSVAYNPESNMKLGSGVAPVTRMLAEGINVGIGTDGASSNNDLDLWSEMRSGAFLQKITTGDPAVLPAYEVLKMATVNGAHAIGRGEELGQIREGMLADLILIDLEKPHLSPGFDPAANLVYCGKSSDVDTVIVNGRIVVEHGKLLTLDSAALCRAADRRAREIPG